MQCALCSQMADWHWAKGTVVLRCQHESDLFSRVWNVKCVILEILLILAMLIRSSHDNIIMTLTSQFSAKDRFSISLCWEQAAALLQLGVLQVSCSCGHSDMQRIWLLAYGSLQMNWAFGSLSKACQGLVQQIGNICKDTIHSKQRHSCSQHYGNDHQRVRKRLQATHKILFLPGLGCTILSCIPSCIRAILSTAHTFHAVAARADAMHVLQYKCCQ